MYYYLLILFVFIGDFMSKKILEQIKYCRERRNISLSELSSKSGISYSYLLQLEKGLKTNPSLNTLEKLCNALDVNITFLFVSD